MVTKRPNQQRSSGHREASVKITAALADVDFPIRKDELAEQVGSRTIPLEEGKEIAIRDMLKHVEREGFKSLSAAQDALDRHWQAYRADVGLQENAPELITEPGGQSVSPQE